MLKILTFNAAILDVRILWFSFHCPIPFIKKRLFKLASELQTCEADVVLLQEIFYRNKKNKLYQLVKNKYPYIAGLEKRKSQNSLGNGLVILSRYPLVNTKLIYFDVAAETELKYASLGFFHAQLIEPEMGKIDVINLHTTGGGGTAHPESPEMEKIRERQIQQVIEYTQDFKYVIVGGDLNAGLQTSPSNYEQVLAAGYIDTFTAVNAQGFTWDPDNPLVQMGLEPDLSPQRIDHLFINKSISEKLYPEDAKIVLNDAVVKIKKGLIPLSDHYGVLTTFSYK